jgi:hypothetical protein
MFNIYRVRRACNCRLRRTAAPESDRVLFGHDAVAVDIHIVEHRREMHVALRFQPGYRAVAIAV